MSEIITKNDGKEPILIMLVGDPGAGKTISACSFPPPIQLHDFDGGQYRSIFHAKDEKGNLRVNKPEDIKVVSYTKKETYSIDLKTNLKGKIPPDCTKESLQLVTKFNGEMKLIKEGQFRTVIVDSQTSMFRLWIEALLRMNNQSTIQIQDYKTLTISLYSQFIPTLKRLPVDYVILTGHPNLDKDEFSGRIVEAPKGPSTNMGKTMPHQFGEVWLQETDGVNYQWRTRRTGLFTCIRSNLDLPNPVKPPTYQELKKYVKELP